MTNCSVDIMGGCGFNITKLATDQVVTDTHIWLSLFNSEMGGLFVVFVMAAFGLILFLVSRKVEGVSESKAFVYATFISSLACSLLFVIDVGSVAVKLLEWWQVALFWVLTAVALVVDNVNRKL